jgi:hypothetical protein
MNQKLTRKTVFSAFIIVSLAAFLFVNLHANLCFQNSLNTLNVVQTQMQERDTKNNDESVKLPPLSLIGKAAVIIDKLISATR